MRLARPWMVCTTLLAVFLSGGIAETTNPDFEVALDTIIPLHPAQCLPFEYMVSADRIKVEVDFSYFPPECNITETLRYKI